MTWLLTPGASRTAGPTAATARVFYDLGKLAAIRENFPG
jgi:hypothetical protein